MKKVFSFLQKYPAVKNLGAVVVAFVLPIIFFTVIVVDAHWFLPFVVCPALMTAAAIVAQGHTGITKWVKWAAVLGVVYAIMIVVLN